MTSSEIGTAGVDRPPAFPNPVMMPELHSVFPLHHRHVSPNSACLEPSFHAFSQTCTTSTVDVDDQASVHVDTRNSFPGECSQPSVEVQLPSFSTPVLSGLHAPSSGRHHSHVSPNSSCFEPTFRAASQPCSTSDTVTAEQQSVPIGSCNFFPGECSRPSVEAQLPSSSTPALSGLHTATSSGHRGNQPSVGIPVRSQVSHTALMSDARMALRRERDRERKRQRLALMTAEEHAAFLQQNRDRYQRRMEARRSLPLSPSLPTEVNQTVWQDHFNPPPLAPQQIDHVVDVLHAHAENEVSRLVGSTLPFSLSVPSGNLSIDFGPASHRLSQHIPDDDLLDIDPSTDSAAAYVPDDENAEVHVPSHEPTSSTSQSSFPPSTRGRRSPLQHASQNCARNYVDSPEYEKFVLPLPTVCVHCEAKLFPYETSNLCCKYGKIVLPYQPPPPELLHLYTSDTAEARHFRHHIRSYNHVFSFTSMGVHLDSSLQHGGRGIYTYRAQGTMYHRIGSLVPQSGQRPRFLQMYVYDTEHELQNRLAENDDLDPRVLAILKNVLDNHNAFVHVLRQISSMPNVMNIRLQLKESRSFGHQYNLPTASQVAAVLIGGGDPSDVCERDIIVQTQGGNLLNVPDTAGFFDPLQYPLLHPYGEFGWDLQLHKQFPRSTLSCRAYYSYILQIRSSRESLILRSGRLFQQYAVDTYVKISTQQLRYLRDHQVKLRAELYQGLHHSVANGETSAANIGRRLILPASFIGSPRDMHERYHDALAIVHKYGKPDLFITMTCNPNWEEILRELNPGETAQDRPDITTRIFHSKCEELKKDLFVKGVLGKVVAHVHVIEFQKRGLPHCHILLVLAQRDKLCTPADYDSVVRAEIPDQRTEPDLFKIVMRQMIHGPCGELDYNQPCIKDRRCKKFFPKAFADYTCDGVDSYPIYRRSRNGPQIVLRNGIVIDNRWVVPYNPWLLRKYNCHINVEICSTISCVKYLYKYVYKGSDRCSMQITDNNDEIRKFVDGRWISAQEALWRIFRFPLNKIYPTVYSMQVHLHNMHEVRFPDDQRLENLLRNPTIRKTMLTEFFYMNSIDPAARQYLYREFPEHYTWSKTDRSWHVRVAHNKVIGRLHTVTPADSERYYLRLLLNHVRGPTSYEHLRTVFTNGVGTTYDTFKEIATHLGLLEHDHAIRECMVEAASIRMPSALIDLFGTLLVFCDPSNAPALWDEFQQFMIQKYPASLNSVYATNRVLADLDSCLADHNKSLGYYGLPTLPQDFTDPSRIPKDIVEELSIETPTEDLHMYERLNSDQKYAFHVVLDSATTETGESHKVFFIDGPGGTGKTFLYRCLLAHFRKKGLIALATATSGLAAIMMPGGRTAHSRFKIPVSITSTSTCKVSYHSDLAKLLRAASLIVWDEATMAHRHLFEALDRSLRDVTGVDTVFGGKLVVLGGDFRQVLPVIPRGTRTDIVNSCVRNSHIWESVRVLPLRQNMRALEDATFSEFLLRIGNGTEPAVLDDIVSLPVSMSLPWTGEDSVEDLITTVFPDLSNGATHVEYVTNRAILTTTNDYVDKINDRVLTRFPGEEVSYFSFDSVDNDPRGLYQPEYLNSISQGALPPHKLTLKIGCPIILTRNVRPRSGLCNGTRLICRNFYPNMIDAEIVTGTYKGSTTFLHRIPLHSTADMKLPFTFTRKQFPIRLSFALTIHKSQGQTIPFVGVFLPHDVFTHGQLYVALSRGKSRENTRLLIANDSAPAVGGVFAKNVVYNEVLS